ncbi:MAG: proprotein convertase P-domain-containing protein [Nannocystaceae bacterium]|nr:proprotein convertase P-domain-containing protein [Nannocystaceae bacterium]
MRVIDLNTKLSPFALAMLLPLALSACADDTSSGDTDDDGTTSTGGPSASATAPTTVSTTDPMTALDTGTDGDTDPGEDTDTGDTDTSADTDTGETDTGETDTGETDTGATDTGSGSSSGGIECGDGVAEGMEECDGDDIGDATCPIAGEVTCADDCTLDMAACSDVLIVCNMPAADLGADQTPEAPLLDVITLADDLFVTDVNVTVDITHTWIGDVTAAIESPDPVAFSLLYNRDCNGAAWDDIDARYDDDGVALVCSDMPPAVAGDVVPLTELGDLIGISAMGDWTFVAWDNDSSVDEGVLNEWCLELTLSADDPVTCGDDTAHYGEACDGVDLNEADCADLEGFIAGDLACADDCSFDTSACVAPGCGNDILEPADESCEGDNLDGADCESIDGGFIGGTLACGDDCSFDTSGCTSPTCGDATIEGDEECVGDDLENTNCDDLPGFVDGTLACDPVSCTFDTSGCNSACGDGAVTGDEECDGTSIGGSSCDDQGFVGGSLDCDDGCGFDVSECSDTVLAYCSAPAITIPTTGPPNQVTDTITVVDVANVADIDIFVDLTHTWNGDVLISITDPNATSVQIRGDDVCNSNNDDIYAFFNDEAPGVADCDEVNGPGIEGNITPTEALSAFDGAAINGDWIITIDDTAGGDGGTFNEWCIYVTAAP